MTLYPRWVRMSMSEPELEAVPAAIAEAERRTSAEIRVHLDRRCPGDPVAQAAAVFERLGMDDARDRSGVLIYLALEDRRLAVLGDRGIHERVGQPYWDELAATLQSHFAQGRPGDGLLTVLHALGDQLHRHFPRRPDDINELTDEVSIEGG